MGLGENIYTHRNAKGWSQTDLAEALDVSRQSVSKWENSTATPDLDKLIKMKTLFGVTLDELVFGESEEKGVESEENTTQTSSPQGFDFYIKSKSQLRMVFGVIALVFGMTMFLLSMFFGNHLYFGEVFGELLSVVIVLVSVAIMFPYDFKVFSVCAIIYLAYSIVCFGILKADSIVDSIFSIVASVIIVVWFIICGEHATRDKKAVSEQK